MVGVMLTAVCVTRYGRCDADSCLCDDGRTYQEADTVYELILCHSCGSSGTATSVLDPNSGVFWIRIQGL